VLALWTIASTAATAFKIVADGSRATLAPLYGALLHSIDIVARLSA
jgi:hypothetical protein